jgi:hypothetical protein
VIVPARLSGMLGGRPDTAEYFQNAYHDMQLGFDNGETPSISGLWSTGHLNGFHFFGSFPRVFTQ